MKVNFLIVVILFSFSIQAKMIKTNNPYDLMIIGQGYFAVIDGHGGITYTEDGNFITRENGDLVDKAGRKVLPGINIPKNVDKIMFDAQGTIQSYNGKEEKTLGTIDLFVKAGKKMVKVKALTSPYQLELVQGMLYSK